MEPLDPRVNPLLVPTGSRAVLIRDKDQDFTDLPSIRTPGGQVITRWSLTAGERRAIAAGEDIFVTILTYAQIQPLRVSVGPIDWRKQG